MNSPGLFLVPKPDPPKTDDLARKRIRESLHESLIVEASAGTGKTTELTARIVEVLAAGLTTVDRIVAVTFTHKAAGELKIRLRQRLDHARQTGTGERRLRLEKALEQLEEASIGTIHGFCAQILRSRPVEAQVDPAFEELTEPAADAILHAAFDEWFSSHLDSRSPGLRRALARLAWRDHWQKGSALDQLRRAAKALVEWRDFNAPWREDSFDRESAATSLLAQCRTVDDYSRQCARSSDKLVTSLAPIRSLLTWLDRGNSRDADTIEAILIKLARDLKPSKFLKGSGPFAPGLPREEVIAAYLRLRAALDDFQRLSSASLAAQLQQELLKVVDLYAERKQALGKLDFLDLLYRTARLLRTDRTVREYFQNRWTHVFIDEFQDTDPLQAEVLLLICAADPSESDWCKVDPVPGKLFLVGDPKQSIYKFRRADVSLYTRLCHRFEYHGVGRAFLTRSHRSVRGLQQFVNAAFSRCLQSATPEPARPKEFPSQHQVDYSPLDESGPEIPGQPAVVALPVADPYGSWREVNKKAICAGLPATIAAYVDWLLRRSGWRVREHDSLVPVRSGHICILFRRFLESGEDQSAPFVKALEARDIPHLLVGARAFHSREEVQALRVALAAIEWPADELSVFATLRGPLFGISDDLLLRFRNDAGASLHPFRKPPEKLEEELQCVADALAFLALLHRERSRRPVADTIAALLEHVRAHAGFALRAGGQQALANVHRLSVLARAYESDGGVSFRGFVEHLEAQAGKEEAPEAPVLEAAADGVRLMTVHNAKGLEFPIVILADFTTRLSRSEPERFLDPERSLCATQLLYCSPVELLENQDTERQREHAEGLRVCYVAATRARDLLIVPAVGDEPFAGGWLAPLNVALYPERSSWRMPDSVPEGWDAVRFSGTATVLNRPFYVPADQERSVHPGLHAPECGSHRVLWHDPSTLDLTVQEEPGTPLDPSILLNEGASEKSLREWYGWQRSREQLLDKASAPSLRIELATDLGEPPVPHPLRTENARGSARVEAAGQRFGTLVHSVLRDLPGSPTPEHILRTVRMQGRILGASEREVSAAVSAAERMSRHPVWTQAMSANSVYREYPVTLSLGDGRILEGVLDLAYFSNGVWTVVDYKTDVDVEVRRSEYENQVRWYLQALHVLTGQPVAGVLLVI